MPQLADSTLSGTRFIIDLSIYVAGQLIYIIIMATSAESAKIWFLNNFTAPDEVLLLPIGPCDPKDLECLELTNIEAD